jgi:hypothetical protein
MLLIDGSLRILVSGDAQERAAFISAGWIVSPVWLLQLLRV